MRIAPLPLLLLGALVLLMAGAALLLAASRRRTAWQRRVAATVPGRPAPAAAEPLGPRLRRALLASPLARRGLGLLGLRAERLDAYRPRWWVVLGIALIVGRVAGGVAGTLLAPSLVLPATLATFVLLSRAAFGALDGRRREALFRQFPDALGHIVRAVRVGIPVTEAIRHVSTEAPAPTGAEFAAIADRLAVGVPLDEALADTAMRTGVPEYRFFATALSLQARTGGGLAETLENLADVIRKRVALRERGYALAAEARTSALILAGLPFFTCGLLAVVNPSYVGVLVSTESGHTALALAGGLLTLGLLSMRFIIRKALS